MRLGSLMVVFLVGSLFVVSLPASAVLPEGTSFGDPHTGPDFPVGWEEFRLDGPFSQEVRMIYPAMEAGEGAEMAGNGPFPWVLFIGDSGEGIGDYMLLTDRLVNRGFIVMVTTAFQDETNLEQVAERITDAVDVMIQQNQTNPHVLGSAGNIDLDHWGLAGHGKGATAAYLAFPYWNGSVHEETVQPPRAVFGLGMDLSDVDDDFSWSTYRSGAVLPQPNTGLFITGTVDEVAPSQSNMERVESIGGIGWHWMHLLGADHYQFQDTSSVFENEDPTLSQSAQLELTADHVVPYLNTVLHGDHASFRSAFNRPQAPEAVSDPSAYISEDLGPSTFLRLAHLDSSHNLSNPLDGLQTLELSTNFTLRNGTVFADLPSTWTVTVECGWQDHSWTANGSVNANGTATCSYPMGPVAPGLHTAWMRVLVEGAPTTTTAAVERTNTPLQLTSPVPTVFVPQRGSSVLNISDVAVDPDGQLVRATNAVLVGPDASHFSVALSGDGLGLTVTHPVDEEWLGECQLQLTLASDGGVQDEANTSLRVLLTDVDDRVRSRGVVPIQELEEDGSPLAVNLLEFVEDPEGVDLVLTINEESFGNVGPVRFSLDGALLTLVPLENRYGSVVLRVMASDGTTQPLEVSVPVVVNSVNDPVVLNTSMWTDLSLDEDDHLAVPLGPWAYDADGDLLVWDVIHNHSDLTANVVNSTLHLEASSNWNGVFTDVRLSVSDGGPAIIRSLNVTVNPVGDMPVASIFSFQVLDGSDTATMQWRVADEDGQINTSGRVLIDGQEVATNHSCLSDTPTQSQCVTLMAFPSGLTGSVSIELRLWDDDLMRTGVVTYLYDMGGNASVSTGDEETAESSLPTVWLVGGLGLLLAVVAVVFLVHRLSSPGLSPGQHEDEVEPQRASKGLLERTRDRL